jgi:pyruvate kinase
MNDQDRSPMPADELAVHDLWEPENSDLEELVSELTALRNAMNSDWSRLEALLEIADRLNAKSAENLVHYLSLRTHDIRRLQRNLARHGISSLGRAESHVMWNITKVLSLLHRLLGRKFDIDPAADPVSFDVGYEILKERSELLLGPPSSDRKVRIMVTLPTEAAYDRQLIRNLIAGGMDCARINCAHDDESVWELMAANIREASQEAGKNCRICVDIAGPKLRTAAFEAGPRVLRLRPKRDLFGRVISPVKVRLGSKPIEEDPNLAADLQLSKNFLNHLRPGTKVKFKDARGSRRVLTITEVEKSAAIAELKKTAYVVPETSFHIAKATGRISVKPDPETIPPVELFATVRNGEELILTRTGPGRPEVRGPDGTVVEMARVHCTLPEVFDSAKRSQRIWFDDGKIGGTIESVSDSELKVHVTSAGIRGNRLRADKGINLPDTDLRLPSLTEKDLSDLKFAIKHADLVGYSFVRCAADVNALRRELRRLDQSDIGIILKIETRPAFDNLPEILLTSLETGTIGVMIARGDLAVEAGFERLAEVQEEILWMCEAAHLPVIWATQVLEQLSKTGTYSRAEITDAAMAERAECVLLNKGPFVVNAVKTLDDVLSRMEPHQDKKSSMMRPLKVAERFFENVRELRSFF